MPSRNILKIGNKAVFVNKYKDVSKIKENDPVYDIIYDDCLQYAKGKTSKLKKDPYSSKINFEQNTGK